MANPDYSEHLVMARKALAVAEEHAARHQWHQACTAAMEAHVCCDLLLNALDVFDKAASALPARNTKAKHT
jgi:hypothetical protein